MAFYCGFGAAARRQRCESTHWSPEYAALRNPLAEPVANDGWKGCEEEARDGVSGLGMTTQPENT